MVTRSTPTKRRTTAKRPVRVMAAPIAAAPPAMTEMMSRLETARCTLAVAGRAAGKFTRNSMRELTSAADAAREPMYSLWRTMRLAGRHIARDAKTAWSEALPAPVLKKPARGARSAAR